LLRIGWVIHGFRHMGLRLFFETGSTAGIQPTLARRRLVQRFRPARRSRPTRRPPSHPGDRRSQLWPPADGVNIGEAMVLGTLAS
jgi:hypothetical protein